MRNWHNEDGESFSDGHLYTLRYLLKNRGMDPQAAIAELNNLTRDQAIAMEREGKRPDGTKLPLTFTIGPLKVFTLYKNTKDHVVATHTEKPKLSLTNV